jgi:hypothetical protein
MNNGMPSTERSRGTSGKAQFTCRNTTQCGQAGSKLIGDFAARSDDNVLLDCSAPFSLAAGSHRRSEVNECAATKVQNKNPG